MKRLVVLAMVAGCSATSSLDTDTHPTAGGADAAAGAPSCSVGLRSSPDDPTAGVSIIVTAQVVNGYGSPTFTWQVLHSGQPIGTTPTLADGSEIQFQAPDAGVYDVSVRVRDASNSCPDAAMSINVAVPDARAELVRLRVVAPGGGPPMYERSFLVKAGSPMNLDDVGLDPGIAAPVLVNGPGGGVPAYLRFSRDGTPDAIVEAFSAANGAVTVRLASQQHTVLVIPSIAGVVPRRITGWFPGVSGPLVVDAGVAVTGTVHDPVDAPIAGAKVQLMIGGVPSTLATTDGDGSFTLHATTGGAVTVDVSPSTASGLPRMSATLPVFNPAGLAVRYGSNLAPVDLGGLVVRRQGVALAHAQVVVLASAAMGAGAVTSQGSVATPATGEFQATATTDGAGKLPALLVPPGHLTAVVTVGAGDLAVVGFATPAASIDVPVMQPIATAMQDPSGGGLIGAVVDFVPVGALAHADAPVIHVVAAASGAISATLASGGHYDLRFRDPASRVGALVIADRVAATVATSYQLPAGLTIRGTLRVKGAALAGAAVQILCGACTGLARERPIAEASSDDAGGFAITVPDPGTM